MPLHGADDVKKMIAKNKRDTNLSLRKIYIKGLSEIVKGTPVDTGRARNNWFLTVGSPFSLLAGRDEDKNGNDSEESLLTSPKTVLGKKIYFTNNLPYIGTLEYGGYPDPVKKGSYNKKKKKYIKLSKGGYSIQAPKGWVRAALMRMRNKIRSL